MKQIRNAFCLAAVLTSATAAQACQVCVPIPVKSAADYLLESELVLFARGDPNKPFSYKSVNVVKGERTSPDIDRFVDSSTRRRLKSNPNDLVLFVRTRKGQLRCLGVADPEYQRIVQRILLLENEWESKGGDRKRAELFLRLFENAAVRMTSFCSPDARR